ncbi:MAG: NAD(P)H-dependent oxidoreductase [Bacteroidia bacterium]|nr:NAD(P)H-dependent oxidoreductase [Bacteroidia bacterium]
MITIINGTHRTDNRTQVFSKACLEILNYEHKTTQVNYLTLEKLQANHILDNMFGKRSPEFQTLIDTYITPAQKFIFLIPEYNGSYPGILKLFIDSIPPSMFKGKKACVIGVSEGKAGCLMGIDHLTVTLNHIGVTTLAQRQPFSNMSSLITNDVVSDESTLTVLKQLMTNFVSF